MIFEVKVFFFQLFKLKTLFLRSVNFELQIH
jgi:hypothetical protein